MLTAQAKQSCEIFTGERLDDAVIEKITGEIESTTKNVILIGMPGCGKSTVGELLSKKLCRPFIDIDDKIKERIHMTICDFFKAYGEEAFRKIETDVLAEYAKLSGQIIATGGGIVTVSDNLPLMKQNGTIVMLNRPLHELPLQVALFQCPATSHVLKKIAYLSIMPGKTFLLNPAIQRTRYAVSLNV